MKKRILKKFAQSKNYQNVRDRCNYTGSHRGVARSICNLRFNVPNEILVVLHKVPNFDYHFIIKELSNEFEGQFESHEQNKGRFKTFSVPVEKEVIKRKKKKKKWIKMVMKILYLYLMK